MVLVLAFALSAPARADPPGAGETILEFFTRDGCPYCERAERWLGTVADERPWLRVVRRDVAADALARERFRAVAEASGLPAVSTPAFYVNGRLEIGWHGEADTGARVLAALERAGPGGAREGADAAGCPVDLDAPVEEAACATEAEPDTVSVPIFGRLDPQRVGLPLFTIVLGLLDGFNPCAMWVLLFLLSLLVDMHSRAKMLVVAGTFVLVSGLVYFAFMAAWLNFFLFVGMSTAVRVVLGILAVFVGSVHVKDFFAFHRGLTLSIPESARPGIYDRVRRILRAENLVGALAGVVALAFLVNVVELLCTAGLPAVYTGVLARHDLGGVEHYAYLALYQVCYMLDDAIMLLLAIVTLSRRRLQERSGRWLKLASGAVMLALGVVILVEPGLLSW